MAGLIPLDWLWIAPAAAAVGVGGASLLAYRRGARRLASKAAVGAGVLCLLAAAPTLAQTAQDIVDLANKRTAAAAADAQSLVDSVKGRSDAYVSEAQAIADDAPARLKQGLGLLQGSPFDPGGDALQQMAKGQSPADGAIYVAVSFSMPPQDLRQLARDAQKAGAVVVIQGLVNGSFKETLLKAKAVFDQDSLGGVAIDPNVFRAFKVQAAPTFIAAKGPVQPCGHGLDCIPAAPANDQVRGNISLAEALRQLSEQGSEAPEVAAAARAKLEG